MENMRIGRNQAVAKHQFIQLNNIHVLSNAYSPSFDSFPRNKITYTPLVLYRLYLVNLTTCPYTELL